MNRRLLNFSSLDDALAELDRLEAEGYHKLGNWSLGQACAHLDYYVRGSLDGFGFMLPWPVRAVLAPIVKRELAKSRPLKLGVRTIPASVPSPETIESDAVAAFRQNLKRFQEYQGPMHPSPLFGAMPKEQWQSLHLKHIAHHFGFLIPKSQIDVTA